MRRPLVVAGLLSAALLSAKLVFPVEALRDPAGEALPAGVHLSFPAINLILAPLFDTWDGVTLLAMPLLRAFVIGCVVIFLIWRICVWRRPLRGHLIATGGFVVTLGLFIGGGIAWRRPMAHLAGVPADWMVVDLHSHTNVSHDVKGWLQGDFDLEASRRWHARGGFDAFFVTDHNRIDGWKGKMLQGTPTACPGEELSLWRAHIVTLGNIDSIPQGMYADSMAGILRLFAESESRWGALTVASIPEYDENHFGVLPIWLLAGVDGFEVSNAAPKANRQTEIHVDSVIAMARQAHRWVAGVTDQHGMGATVQAWTLISPVVLSDRIPESQPHACRELVAALSGGGASATEVIERHRLRIDSGWPVWSAPVAVVWEGWRAAGWLQVGSWLIWIWVIAGFGARRRKPATT